SRPETAAMERWNHQGRAPRKRHRKRPPLHRRWRLTARRLKSGRSEKQLACLCVLMLGYRKFHFMSTNAETLSWPRFPSTLDAHQLVTRDFHARVRLAPDMARRAPRVLSRFHASHR